MTVEAENGTYVTASTGWLFWNLMVYPLLGEENNTFHRAGFEPQRASPFMKRVKAPQELREDTRA
jgi:hypothetical protein